MTESENLRNEDQLLLLMEEMQNQIEQMEENSLIMQKKMSTLSSENSKLRKEVQKRSETIISQNEKIEKLSESNLVLQQNEYLRQKNKELQQLEQKTRKEAKEEIIAVKNKLLEEAKAARKKCETKEASLDSRIQEVVQREESVSVKESDLNSEIKTKAESLVISKKSYLERIYEDETHNMQSKYQQMVIAYKGIMFFAMFYGFIITLITALNTDSFASDCVIFVKTIYGAAKTVFGWIISVGSLAAKIGDMIPVDILAAIAHWLILIIVSGVLVYGVALIFFRIGKQYVDFLLEKQADDISAVVGLSILAIIVFMADSIKAFISINLTGLMVLVFVMYSAVRGWVQANSQRF